MNKERFLAFTDAIIAIIATIMVLDLPRPTNESAAALSTLGIPIFAYFLSFLMIWNVWYNHHALFKEVKIINARIYWLTGLWILVMSLFPLITGYVGRYPNARIPELLYLIVLTVWAITFNLTEIELIRENPHIVNTMRPYGGSYRIVTFAMLVSGYIVIWFWPAYILVTVLFLSVMAIFMQLRHRGQQK
ncbi:TMEM175 family protein [Lactococcus nasutitermitis]|uniref:TMEM175 family protein n=1 Tax=Lactococcus nasutitermitis TaxID=1652957 RepID=A0ABV9JD93_9LACT|nr:TMEM175 family protein [Lactococcus nasutitermitis]